MQKFKEEKGASSINVLLIIIIIILLLAIASVLIIGIRNGKIQLRNKEENKTITQSDEEDDDSYLKCLGKTDDGGYLYVDKYSNKKILDFYQYDICYNTRAVENDSKYSLKKIDGTIVVNPGVYDSIKKIHETYSGKYYIVTKDSKYGIIDYEGKVIIPLEYNMILEEFIEGKEKSTENVLFICNKKEETSTGNKIIIFNSSGSRVYECENQDEEYYKTIEMQCLSMDNGVSIMAVRNKISGEAYLINTTSSEILEKYDKIDSISGEVSNAKNYISIHNDNRALVVEKRINDNRNKEMYFFNREKKKSLTIDCDGYSIRGSPYYYIFYDFKKTIVYNEFGEKVKELNGLGYVYNSKINPKTYFKLDNTLYDEQFKEIDSGNITECTGNHYLKDGIVYTMDKQEVAKDVTYLTEYFIRTNDNKICLLNGADKIELDPDIKHEWDFIGSNNEYFFVRENNQIVIYKSDGLKELWRIKADSIYSVNVDNKCNVIQINNKYYNFKGEELYEEK